MSSVTHSNLQEYLNRFIPLYEILYENVSKDSYVIIEVSDTSLSNFKVVFREVLSKLETYPHQNTHPLDTGSLNPFALLAWWRNKQVGTRHGEDNCAIVKVKGHHVPTKQFHVKFNFYAGLETRLHEIKADDPGLPVLRTSEPRVGSTGISRPYNEAEFRAFHFLKSREAIRGNVVFTGVTPSQLPKDVRASNVPIIDDMDGPIPIIVLL